MLVQLRVHADPWYSSVLDGLTLGALPQTGSYFDESYLVTGRTLHCFGVIVLASVFARQPWIAATVSAVAGLFAQSIGAAIYKAARWFTRNVLR